jgi:hypothetical protein
VPDRANIYAMKSSDPARMPFYPTAGGEAV